MPPATRLEFAMYTPFTGTPFDALPEEIGSDSPEARLDWLALKLEQAKYHLNDRDAHKVFVAPEWMFRKKYPNDPITVNEFMTIVQKVTELSQHYPRFLIIPGSISWATGRKSDWTIYNAAPVVSEGEQLGIFYKTNEADIINRKYHRWGGEKITTTGLFTWAGLNCGLEICADHSAGVLLSKYVREFANGTGVDLHLYISASNPIIPGNMIARDQGIMLQCEGNNSDDRLNLLSSSTVGRVTRVGTVKDRRDCVNGARVSIARVPQDQKRFTGANIVNRIVIYPAMDI